MKKTYYALAIATLALSVTSCDPNEGKVTPPRAKTRTELLTAGKWRISAGSVSYTKNGKTEVEDLYKDMEACEKDNFMLFSTDGTLTNDEGPTKCDTADDQTSTSSWKLYDNDSKMILTENGYIDTAVIEELSETTFKFTTTYGDSSTTRLTPTYSRIN